ncbi:unnamed protein product [Ectocarpus sp. 4 AP-2014]
MQSKNLHNKSAGKNGTYSTRQQMKELSELPPPTSCSIYDRGNTPVSSFTVITPTREIPRERRPREAPASDRCINSHAAGYTLHPTHLLDSTEKKKGVCQKPASATPKREKDRVSSGHLSFADPPLDTQHNKTTGPKATRCDHAISLPRQSPPLIAQPIRLSEAPFPQDPCRRFR